MPREETILGRGSVGSTPAWRQTVLEFVNNDAAEGAHCLVADGDDGETQILVLATRNPLVAKQVLGLLNELFEA